MLNKCKFMILFFQVPDGCHLGRPTVCQQAAGFCSVSPLNLNEFLHSPTLLTG